MSANLGKCVQSWISRARSLPLSLRLVGSTRPECDRVFSILRQHAQRLQHLALVLDWDNLSNSSDLGQPILRSRAFDGAEQLRSVDMLFGVIPGMFALPWAQLTRFLVSSLTVKECVQILRDCPLLKECCFHRINLIRDLHAGPLLRHSSLEDLTIEPAVGALIAALDLPTLRALHLCGSHLSEKQTPFLPFLTRTAASLRTFSWTDYYFVDSDEVGIIMDWFHIMTWLTTVELNSMALDVVIYFVRALNRSVDAPFLPHLRSLQITSWRHFVSAEMMDALLSRCAGVRVEAGAPQSTNANLPQGTNTQPMKSLRLIVDYPNMRHPVARAHVRGAIDWDALRDFAEQSGMDIHLGPREYNLLWNDRIKTA
ncbi:hypothetical protein C8R43DRAFT_968889 [Mycena crocata]|nr:hypothetical protein C8R43DRAFT_968889 [Mycena crocata]